MLRRQKFMPLESRKNGWKKGKSIRRRMKKFSLEIRTIQINRSHDAAAGAGLTLHRDLAKFFFNCSETELWIFLVLAALPDILRGKKTQAPESIVPFEKKSMPLSRQQRFVSQSSSSQKGKAISSSGWLEVVVEPWWNLLSFTTSSGETKVVFQFLVP